MADHDEAMRHAFNAMLRGYAYSPAWPADPGSLPPAPNPLRTYFHARETGRMIWKWDHYLDIYHRHFERFRNRDVRVLEIGVYGGGSLEMWRDYFGPQAKIYGVDILPDCKRLESERIEIAIGDQGDRNFWRDWRTRVSEVDIVIDDGGHQPEQQAVTLEELLPHLRAGGVYVCEDIHGTFNPFAIFAAGLAQKLNDAPNVMSDADHRKMVCAATPFQQAVRAIHAYPFMTVIERNDTQIVEFTASKRGDEQPVRAV